MAMSHPTHLSPKTPRTRPRPISEKALSPQAREGKSLELFLRGISASITAHNSIAKGKETRMVRIRLPAKRIPVSNFRSRARAQRISAKPTAKLTFWIGALLTKRNASQMGAQTDHHQPGVVLNAITIFLRVAQIFCITLLGVHNLVCGPATNENRLALPNNINI